MYCTKNQSVITMPVWQVCRFEKSVGNYLYKAEKPVFSFERIDLSFLVLVSEPVEGPLFKFTEPKLNFNGDDAIDISHIASSKNDS